SHISDVLGHCGRTHAAHRFHRIARLSDAEREFALGLRARKLGDRRTGLSRASASETGGSIHSSVGISVATEPFDNRNFDTLMVGGSAVAGALTPGVIKFL